MWTKHSGIAQRVNMCRRFCCAVMAFYDPGRR